MLYSKFEVMKIEIWSDIVCPFCYIGKKRFESALADFGGKELVEVEWKSFQLNPNQEEDTDLNAYEDLSRSKNQTLEWSINAHQYVSAMADEVGLQYNFEIAKPTNTFKAHTLLQLAKELGKGSEMKEILCHAYFIEGKLISDEETLADLGAFLDLDRNAIISALKEDKYRNAVKKDIEEARTLGINAVPAFVFERKFLVNGAQAVEKFSAALKNVQHHLTT